jgi:pSer/pThr/pTyr-binding forkhead associated (FHA) protein
MRLTDPKVSRRHLALDASAQGLRLTDLGSTNGSRLNGRRIDGSEVLREGDEIELGESVMTFTQE